MSRRQATLKLEDDGNFYLTNDGRFAMLVDGEQLQMGERARLRDQSVIQIAHFRLTLSVNPFSARGATCFTDCFCAIFVILN